MIWGYPYFWKHPYKPLPQQGTNGPAQTMDYYKGNPSNISHTFVACMIPPKMGPIFMTPDIDLRFEGMAFFHSLFMGLFFLGWLGRGCKQLDATVDG